MGADWGGTASSQREEEPRRRPASARTTPVTAATRIASARGGRATGVQRATAWYQPHNTRVLSARCAHRVAPHDRPLTPVLAPRVRSCVSCVEPAVSFSVITLDRSSPLQTNLAV